MSSLSFPTLPSVYGEPERIRDTRARARRREILQTRFDFEVFATRNSAVKVPLNRGDEKDDFV